MSKVIKFIPASNDYAGVFDPPVPTKQLIPEWYKKQEKYTGGTKSYNDIGLPNHTIKACMPVFDMITAGYTIKMPADLRFYVDENTGLLSNSWSTNAIKLIESHPVEQYNHFDIDDSFHSMAFKFINPWIIKTPPGYSCLFLTPTYRDDLPFYIFPAIVDTDMHPVSVNFPFLIKKDFVGVIEMGSPIVQVIPFKRDSWNSEVIDKTDKSLSDLWRKAEGRIGNRYKSFFREQKVWN